MDTAMIGEQSIKGVKGPESLFSQSASYSEQLGPA